MLYPTARLVYSNIQAVQLLPQTRVCPNILILRTKPEPTSGADVAQLVEQLIRNQQVSGSSPLVGSSLNLWE